MAYASVAAAPHHPGALRRAANYLLETLVWLAEIGPMSEAVRRLNALTDEDLAARGTTRTAEVARIFGPRAHY